VGDRGRPMSTDPRLGTEIAGYRIESVLGRGGMGVVYVARHPRLDRTVALKVVSPELAEDPKFRDRFVRESKLAASLEHPNIVPIYDAGEAEGTLYLAMRLIQGTDLKSLIAEDGALDPGRTVRLLEQGAGALDTAHAAGLVHRDVKPGNVLIGAPGSRGELAYLSDFGLTKRMTSDSGITGTGQFVGTLDYAAPEQFEGKQLDGRADVYSLGCVLYECLTGEIPFRRDNQAALVYAHLMADPPKVTEAKPDLPQALDAVVAKGMAKKPEERYSTAGELLADARDILGARAGAEVGAAVRKEALPPKHGPAGPGPAPRSRWPRPMLVGAGALALIAAVIAAVLLSTGDGGKLGPSSGPSAAGAVASKDRVVRVNPSNRQVLASIPTGSAPSGVATGEGSVWVANSGDGTVSRIDPVGNKVTGVIRVGKSPAAIAFGEGAVWVANFLGNSVSRIDPATNKVVATIPLDGNPTSVAAGEGSVFVASALQIIVTEPFPVVVVWLIDPDTNTVTASSRVVGGCNGLVAQGDGGAWLTTEQVVARVEPATGKILSEFTPGVTIFGITVGDGSVWVARGGLPARVLRLDAAGARVEAEIPVGNSRPGMAQSCPRIAMTTGNGSLWVTNVDDGSISQIATVSNDPVDSFVVGKGLTGLAIGQGALWVTVDVP
jgi:YVTN family beta-propeller protein